MWEVDRGCLWGRGEKSILSVNLSVVDGEVGGGFEEAVRDKPRITSESDRLLYHF